MKKELIAYRDSKSPISEVFRTLRTNIQFMNTDRKLKTLLITSTSPGEGKSWVSSNLAVTFAQAGKRVILVDADMRKGRQYTIFGALPKPGLSNYLSGIDEDNNESDTKNIARYIQKTKINNLCLMSAGNIPPNPSELLISTKMMRLLEELKELSDIVIIDGTPCELVTDAVILSRIVDSTIVVTAYAETKKEALQRVLQSIDNVNGKIAGIVVNKVPIRGKKYQQQYYYGYGLSNTANSDFNTKSSSSARKNPHSSARKTKNKKSKKMDREIENTAKELYYKEKVKQKREKAFLKEAKNEIDKEKKATKKETKEKQMEERANDMLEQINNYMSKDKKGDK